MKVNIEEVKEIAKIAGKGIMKCYKNDLGVIYKKGDKNSPLTKADLASNWIICASLKKYGFPVLSEESKDDLKRLKSEFVWIIDPLDGTSDFIEKTGEFAVMIGLIQNKKPILGVIYEPVSGYFYFAQEGSGSYSEKNGKKKRMAVSSENDFSNMKILLSRNHLLKKDLNLCDNLKIEKRVRRGSTSKICLIASGEAELYVNTSDKTGEWDTCAGEIIIKEAGGKITDLCGNSLVYNKKIPKNINGFVVSNGARHGDIIRELKKV